MGDPNACRAVVASVASLLLAGCCGFTTPRASTLATIAPMALARLVPGQFVCELTSPGLSGTFDAVCGVDGDAFRLQLFPDVGGKVFDLHVTANAVAAEWPGGRYRAEAPLAGADPHLALLLAALFAELLAPVTATRVLGERGSGDAICVRLRPALGSGAVVARLRADGQVVALHVELGPIGFDVAEDGRITARGVTARLLARGDG